MGNFDVSLKTMGDRKGLPATIRLGDGRLAIDAGDESIGDWSLDEIRLEPIPTGYRMSAEGDQILLELRDIDGFTTELNSKPKRFGRTKSDVKVKPEKSPKTDKPPKANKSPKADKKPRPEKPPREKKSKREKNARPPKDITAKRSVADRDEPASEVESEGDKPGLVERIDLLIDGAEKKWGSLLPPWVFTRIMFMVVVIALILMIIFPTWVSTFLLIAGLVIVVLGAVIYTDPMLGAKYLPGRMAPAHVLLFGLAIVMFGVLLGVIAN